MAVASLGLLGGAFDPPHNGHVALAHAAIEELELRRLLVLVVADPGHKSTSAAAATRLALARLAFVDVPEAEVELDPHPRTVDFLEEWRPEDAVFVIGSDELAAFPRWKRPERVLELVRLAVAVRPGVPDDAVAAALAHVPDPTRVIFFPLEPVDVSSSEVRSRVARGDSIEGLVPPGVQAEIARRGLYRDPG
jgi:nicotinate-nucleotide adenylyltransferase